MESCQIHCMYYLNIRHNTNIIISIQVMAHKYGGYRTSMGLKTDHESTLLNKD